MSNPPLYNGSMLIIVNGTLGVGKTWAARALMCKLPSCAYIEGDVLGFVSDDMLKSRTRSALALEIACDLVAAYKRRGIKSYILDYLFTSPSQLDEFVSRLGEPVVTFYLSGSRETIEKRIKMRGRPHFARELAEAGEIERQQRSNFGATGLGKEIATDGLDWDEVADSLLENL